MKKMNADLEKATVQIAVGVLAFSAVMQVIYTILVLAIPALHYAWSFPVGNLFMACIMTLNFFLMARGFYRAVDTGDTEAAKKQIQFSHLMRTAMIIFALVASFLMDMKTYAGGIAACITVAFPQFTVFALRMLHRVGENETPDTPAQDATAETANAATSDGDGASSAAHTPERDNLPDAGEAETSPSATPTEETRGEGETPAGKEDAHD